MGLKANFKQISQSKNFKHGILYTLFSFANSGIGFVLLLILAKYLKPEDYGELNLFTTFVTLLNFIISLCTTSYVAVCFFQKNKDDVRKVIQIVFVTTTSVLIILSVLLILFPIYSAKIIGVPIEYLWIGLMICYFGVFNNVNLDIWRLEEKPISYGLYSLSFAVCNFILSFWLIVGMRYGWEGRVYAWSILAILYFVISIIFLINRKYLIFTKPSYLILKETLIYAIPLIPHSVSFWLKSGLDRYIINYFYDQSTVGYYSFAMNLAAIITIIGTAFNATNSVYIYKKLSEGYDKAKGILSRQTKIMTILFLLVTLVVMLFAWGLIHWILPKYNDSIKYIIPLCLAGFFQCIYLLWVNYLFYYKRTKQLMHITLGTALLQAILSIWLTRYSSIITAYVSMGIVFTTAFFVFTISKRILGNISKSYGSERIFKSS